MFNIGRLGSGRRIGGWRRRKFRRALRRLSRFGAVAPGDGRAHDPGQDHTGVERQRYAYLTAAAHAEICYLTRSDSVQLGPSVTLRVA